MIGLKQAAMWLPLDNELEHCLHPKNPLIPLSSLHPIGNGCADTGTLSSLLLFLILLMLFQATMAPSSRASALWLR